MKKRSALLSVLAQWRTRAALFVAVAGVLLLALACGGGGDGDTVEDSSAFDGVAATLYRSPACGCCQGHEQYLSDYGFEIESFVLDDVNAIKEEMGVPRDMWSCHTTVIDGYFIEGHVPIEAIQRLLEEKPAIDGIALPGMEAGSPGMGGEKEGPWVIYSVTGGAATEFMQI